MGKSKAMDRNGRKEVVVANPVPMLRLGWQHLVAVHSEMRVCGEAATLARAYELCLSKQPDVLVLDPTMENGEGFIFMKKLPQWQANVRLVVFSSQLSSAAVDRAFKLGAVAVISCRDSETSILTALMAASEGRFHMSPCVAEDRSMELAGQLPQAFCPAEQMLTDRELHIYRLIGQGFPMKQVAHEAGISVKTVESHKLRMKQKLELRSYAELRRQATLFVGNSGSLI